jgi:hypothetical protein
VLVINQRQSDEPTGDSFRSHVEPPRTGTAFKGQVTVDLKDGPHVLKRAHLTGYGPPDEDRVGKESLVLRKYKRRLLSDEFDFSHPEECVKLEGDEITRLQALLNREFPETGRYAAARADADSALNDAVSALVNEGKVNTEAVHKLVRALADIPGVADVLDGAAGASLLSDAIALRRQQQGLEALRRVAEDPTSDESAFQGMLKDHLWIFGGRFVGEYTRRNLVVGEELDFPLLRPDGSLHLVEIKTANVPRLVKVYRNKLIVGNEVNEAVGQVLNYLKSLDARSDSIFREFGFDSTRASATVVIGHPRFATIPDHIRDDVNCTLRTYNSHLARVEVITYKDLIDGAQRSLTLAGSADGVPDQRHPSEDAWDGPCP